MALSGGFIGQARVQFQEARRLAPNGRQEQWEAYQALTDDYQVLARRQVISGMHVHASLVDAKDLTANAFKEDAEKSISAGCTTHVIKPIKKKVLIEAIVDIAELEKLDVGELDGPLI